MARPLPRWSRRALREWPALLAVVLSLTVGVGSAAAQAGDPVDALGFPEIASVMDAPVAEAPAPSSDSLTTSSETEEADSDAEGSDALAMESLEPEPLLLDFSALEAELPTDTTEALRDRPLPLTVFGYYRLFMYGRNMTEPYPNLAPFERAYSVGDGYREPMLSVTVLGRPNGRSSFGTELFVFTPYDGTPDVEDNTVSLNLGVNFYGNFRTEAGNFGVRAGGIHWYNLSPFTIGVYQVLDRFSIFDRTPWEGVDGASKYTNYFETGQANPGDQRWNFQAFQGLILNGSQLPGEIAFDAFFGKTQPNGGLPGATTDPTDTVPGGGESGGTPTYVGFSGEARALPSFIGGGRLARAFGDNLVAYNGLYSYRTLDSLTSQRREYQVHSASFDANAYGVNLSGELGASRFQSPTFEPRWGEALMLRAKTDAETTGLPIDLQVYQVGRNFFNENGEIATNNNPELRTNVGCDVSAGDGGIGGVITQVNQLAHNRRGINFNTAWEGGPAKLGVGWGMAHELAPTTTELSYVHRINGLAQSRIYNPFPANATCATQFGPLGRQYSFFRGVFERVRLTDVEPVTGLALNRKYYHAVDLTGKLRGRLLDRNLYLFYLGSFGSANTSATVLPRDDDTYVFVQYHEFDLYAEVVPGFLLTGYVGLENARGGQFTEISEVTGQTRDQISRGFGVGFDWIIARNTGLFVRHRWMDFEDRGFPIDTYQGRETTFELKIFI